MIMREDCLSKNGECQKIPILEMCTGTYILMSQNSLMNSLFYRYDYKSYCTDVSKFPTPRFASEFGLQSYPSFRAMKNISIPDVSQSQDSYKINLCVNNNAPQDWSNDSPLMLHRQHHPDGNKQMEAQMAMFFHLPNK